MSDTVVTIRLPQELRDRLQAISTMTKRSKSFLGMEAITRFIESEEDIIKNIKAAQEDVKTDSLTPHDEFMSELDEMITIMEKDKIV